MFKNLEFYTLYAKFEQELKKIASLIFNINEKEFLILKTKFENEMEKPMDEAWNKLIDSEKKSFLRRNKK